MQKKYYKKKIAKKKHKTTDKKTCKKKNESIFYLKNCKKHLEKSRKNPFLKKENRMKRNPIEKIEKTFLSKN